MQPPAIRLLTVADRAAWEAATADGLPAQSWGHAAGLAAGGWAPELAVVTAGAGRLLLPFHRRTWRGAVDIATLPGLSGAWLEGEPLAPLRAWDAFARAQGWVASYLQLAPVEDGLPAVVPADVGRLEVHNALFVIDLGAWDIARSVGVNMRRSIRLGERLGAEFVTDPARIAPVFAALHGQTLARSGTPELFDAAVLAGWFATPGVLAFGAAIGGEIVAAQLGRAAGGWADLHLAGAAEAGRPLQAWLIAQAAEACREMGLGHANIGGYGQVGDGLHQMKARLGAREMPLRSLRQVHDVGRFAALCAAAGVDPADTYFPPWRRVPA
jgi:hypothetical protein